MPRPAILSRTLAVCLAFGACAAPSPEPSAGGRPGPGTSDLATISLQLTSVPSDVRCVRALVTAYEMVIRSVDVSPGAGSQAVSFPGLPLGPASVYFDAFNVACASVGSNTAASWVAIEPSKLDLVAGQVANVSVELRRPTSITGSFEFTETPPGLYMTPAHAEITGIVGGLKDTVRLTIHNATPAAFTPEPAILTGDAADFQVDDLCRSTLAAGDTCELRVHFVPRTPGSKRVIVRSGGLYATIVGAAVRTNDVRFEPPALDFGGVAVGQQKTLSLTLVNRSNVAYPTGDRQTSGVFEIAGTTCRDQLAAGDSCTIDVRFAPVRPELVVGSVSVNFDVTAELTGGGEGAGSVSFIPDVVSLGDVVIGEESFTSILLFNDTGSSFPVALTHSNPDYHFQATNCPALLPPGEACDVNVVFRPTSDFGFNTVSAGPGSLEAAISAHVVVPHVTFTPPSHDFGNVAIGQPVLKTFTVTTDTTIHPLFGTSERTFRVTSNSTCGATLIAGQSCTLEVRFNPGSVGPFAAELELAPFLATAPLAGSGVLAGAVSLSPTTNELGTVPVGQSKVLTLTLTNTTPTAFSPDFKFGGPNAPEFLRGGGTCGASLAGNSSCTFIVSFRPSVAGAKSATLTAGGPSNVVSLSGMALASAATITPSPFDFGSVGVGQFLGRTFTVTNVSTAPVATSTSFSPAGEFLLDGSMGTCQGAPLAAGASCTLVVRFQPSSAGAKSGLLVVGGDAARVGLSGAGVGSAAPITNLVVNDTALGGDNIPNNQQWSVQTIFGAGVAPFGDRKVLIKSTGDHSLDGLAWIKTAADSKAFPRDAGPVATFKVTGSTIFLLVDDRHNVSVNNQPPKPPFLNSGYTDAGFDVVIQDDTMLRPYSVWKRAVVSGTTVDLPGVGSSTAPGYLVVVQ
jgi:hypothetical protein